MQDVLNSQKLDASVVALRKLGANKTGKDSFTCHFSGERIEAY